MARYRQIHTSFWQDPFILDLTPEEKYFYLYLMTNSKVTQCGIYQLPKRIAEAETGYTRETVDKYIARFVEYGKILYDESSKEIMIRNWMRHNAINSPKVKACLKKELAEVRTQSFLDEFDRVCIEIGYGIDTVSKSNDTVSEPNDTVPIDLGEEERSKNKEKELNNSRRKRVYDADSLFMKMAEYLRDKIIAWKPNARIPKDLNAWADDFRKLHDLDGRSREAIAHVIDFATSDSFWQVNILSAGKLREKFDQLEAKAQQKSGGHKPAQPTKPKNNPALEKARALYGHSKEVS